MGLAEELYCAILEAGYVVQRHTIPELADPTLYTARKRLPIWRENESSIVPRPHQPTRNHWAASGRLRLREYIANETEIN